MGKISYEVCEDDVRPDRGDRDGRLTVLLGVGGMKMRNLKLGCVLWHEHL